MATVTKQWCSWASDQGKVSYVYDDTVSSGFPFGKLSGFSWANNSDAGQQITVTLRPGVMSADIAAGTVTSIPVAAGVVTPFQSGQNVNVGGVDFVASAGVAVGATAIPAQSQSIGSLIPSGSLVRSILPVIPIPVSGQQATLPAFYGGGQVSSTGSVSVAALNVPMIQITSHGINYVTVPADLTCAG